MLLLLLLLLLLLTEHFKDVKLSRYESQARQKEECKRE
jgi:hypothetical protein